MKLFTALLLILPFLSLAQDREDIPYILNDSFVSNAFGFPLSLKNFRKNYGDVLGIAKKPIRNIHNPAVVDTIYTFSSGRTKVEFYKAKHDDFLQCAYIETNKISLKDGIKVGISKAETAKGLKAAIAADKVRVGDLEQGQVYTFIFIRGKLAAIAYEGYVD